MNQGSMMVTHIKENGRSGSDTPHSDADAGDILTLAKLAGLERALTHFPDDVTTAAKTALKIRASFQAPVDNTAELWPVMQVKS
jgi:hypothetical protein